jgi:hypothetical protein
MSAREDLTERSAEGFAERCRAGRIREESITVWRFLPLSAFEVPADFCALLLNRARKWFLRFRSRGIRILDELALKHERAICFLFTGVAEFSLKVCVTTPVATPSPSFNSKAQPHFHDSLN